MVESIVVVVIVIDCVVLVKVVVVEVVAVMDVTVVLVVRLDVSVWLVVLLVSDVVMEMLVVDDSLKVVSVSVTVVTVEERVVVLSRAYQITVELPDCQVMLLSPHTNACKPIIEIAPFTEMIGYLPMPSNPA
jgi:hypothetical protein